MKKRYLVRAFDSNQECEDFLNSKEMEDYVCIQMADTNRCVTVVLRLAVGTLQL
jgi:hypothetical protein